MKNIVNPLFSLVITGLALSVIANPAEAKQSPEKQADWRMAKMDTDKDGTVSPEEFAIYRIEWVESSGQDPKLATTDSIMKTYLRMDTNTDGKVTREEMIAFVKIQQSR